MCPVLQSLRAVIVVLLTDWELKYLGFLSRKWGHGSTSIMRQKESQSLLMPSHGEYKMFLPGGFQMSVELDHLRAQIFPKWPSSQNKGWIRADGVSLGGLISAFESSWLPPSVLSQKLLFPKVVNIGCWLWVEEILSEMRMREAWMEKENSSLQKPVVVWAWKITCSGLALRKRGAVGKTV